MRIAPFAAAIAITCLATVACQSERPDSTTSQASPTPPSDSSARPARHAPGVNDECPEGVEGKGLRMVEPYPPKPYFESFNLWRTKTETGRTGCLTIVAGRQQSHSSEGEDDPTTYHPNGWLFIFGDYQHDKDGIGGRKVPLPRPVRVVLSSGHGYEALLLLQSLKDCSTIAYDVSSATFKPDSFHTIILCPKRNA